MNKEMELCRGRHEIPQAVDGSIFKTEVDPLDVRALEAEAADVLKGTNTLTLYVTGLSVALVAVINVCHDLGINLTLMHYNRATGEYYPQPVR